MKLSNSPDESVFWEGLGHAAYEFGLEVDGESAPARYTAKGVKPFLPAALNNSAMKKVVQVSRAALFGIEGDVSDFQFKSGELEDFVRSVMSGVGLSNVTPGRGEKASSLSSARERGSIVGGRLHKYLVVYYAGKFKGGALELPRGSCRGRRGS